MLYDVVIVGGGPSGLSAALALGRARKRVLLCDSGPRRNAAAQHIHNFVTRDGTPPEAFRQIGREQLAPYPSVELRASSVESIAGSRDGFRVQLSSGTVDARRILLATGMIDDMLPLEGFRALWGSAIFQCPYCHGWEERDKRWGYLASSVDWSHQLAFVMMLRSWSSQITLLSTEALDLPSEQRARLDKAGIRVEASPVKRLLAADDRLASVELVNGTSVPLDVLFAHPPQRQVSLVGSLGRARRAWLRASRCDAP